MFSDSQENWRSFAQKFLGWDIFKNFTEFGYTKNTFTL